MNNTPENFESFDFEANRAQMQKKNRNVWLLTCAVFAGVFLIIIACTAFILGIFAVVFGAMRSSTPYQEALVAVQTDATAIELLGEPIEAGWLMSGSINTSGSSGDASFSIPVSGPKGKGTVYVEAYKSGGVWQYTQLYLEVEGEPRVPLITGR